MARPATVLALAFIGLVGLSCCSNCGGKSLGKTHSASPIEIGAMSLSIVDGSPPLLDESSFEQLARTVLTGLLAPVDHPPTAKLVVEGSFLATQDGAAQLSLLAGLRLSGLPWRMEIHVVGSGQAQNHDEAIALTTVALKDLRAALVRHLTLVDAPSQRLVRGLDAAEADEQLLCARLLGLDKDRSAIPALGRLLRDPREIIADAAAEALVAIGDRAAVPVLIAGIERGDLRSEVRAIEAMARLGGPEARAYLEMTAQGHPHPEVQKLSQSLLSRMVDGQRSQTTR